MVKSRATRAAVNLFMFLVLQGIRVDEALSFNRKLMGVQFDPYVRAEVLNGISDKSTYTSESLRTMLEVVSTKISRVLITSMGVGNVPYKRNETYYRGADMRARTAEIAAEINRERKNLSLTVMIGISHYDSPQKTNTEIRVALEAAKKSQSIFPGSVEGLYILDYTSLSKVSKANKILKLLETIRKFDPRRSFRIGVRQLCDRKEHGFVLRSDSPEIKAVKNEIIFNLDFVICATYPNKEVSEMHGAIAAFQAIRSQVLIQRNEIKSINYIIDVMWQTRWRKPKVPRMNDTTTDIVDLRDYWMHANEFAMTHNYAVWLDGAFDIPHRRGLEMGWWKLTRHDLLYNKSGYVELVPKDFQGGNAQLKPRVQMTSTVNVVHISQEEENASVNPEINATEATKPQSELSNQTKTPLETFTSHQHAPVITDENDETKDNVHNASFQSTEKLPKVIESFENITTESTEEPATAEEADEEAINPWKFYAILIGAISLVTIVVTICAGCTYMAYVKRRSSRFRVLTRQEINEFRHGIADNDYNENGDESFVNVTALNKPYDRFLEIPKEKLKIFSTQRLGGGEFGCVFKALIWVGTDNEKEVALKMTKPNTGPTALKGLLSEIKILSYLGKHPNIVPILGAYTAEIHKGTVYIATELCPLGSLKACLKNCRDSSTPNSVPLNDMIRWSYEIACGMEYLEQKGVIHADLATRNVLLSSESIAKVSDFGLSRRLYEYTNYTKKSQEPLPWRWMAFESLKMMEFSSKSDVWSYGVTLWEIFSLGAQPYPGIGWTFDFVESLEEGFRLKKPRYATPEVFNLMENCWKLDVDARSTFTELKDITCSLFHLNSTTVQCSENIYVNEQPA